MIPRRPAGSGGQAPRRPAGSGGQAPRRPIGFEGQASIDIEPVGSDDLDEVLALLARHQLPPDGLRDHLATTLVARHSGRIVGSAALELYPEGALLRSVAVVPEMQGRGIGRDLTTAAIRLAQDRRAPAIYLLTTTAENYFPRLGFERIPRADVPTTVRASVEFTSACPANATVMRKLF